MTARKAMSHPRSRDHVGVNRVGETTLECVCVCDVCGFKGQGCVWCAYLGGGGEGGGCGGG